jgi:hypothetical protein
MDELIDMKVSWCGNDERPWEILKDFWWMGSWTFKALCWNLGQERRYKVRDTMFRLVILLKTRQKHILMGRLHCFKQWKTAATDTNRSKVRDMLGSFLFRDDDVKKGKDAFWRRKKPSSAL